MPFAQDLGTQHRVGLQSLVELAVMSSGEIHQYEAWEKGEYSVHYLNSVLGYVFSLAVSKETKMVEKTAAVHMYMLPNRYLRRPLNFPWFLATYVIIKL